MADGAFKVLDSDIHIIEPPDLWPRYIDPAFRDQAPVGLTEDEGDLRLALHGKPWGRNAIDADRSKRRQGRNYALNQKRWRPVPAQTLAQLQALEQQLQEKDIKLTELLIGKEALDAELERLRAEIAEAKKQNAAIPD